LGRFEKGACEENLRREFGYRVWGEIVDESVCPRKEIFRRALPESHCMSMRKCWLKITLDFYPHRSPVFYHPSAEQPATASDHP
jgi:hypothetical protein